ncbi:3-oxoacyl-[acyl-carrier-protein] reductase [Lachancea thermotolerans]
MSTRDNRTYFITGGNRGLGHALVKALSAFKENTIITTVRGPLSLPKNSQLEELRKDRGNIHILQLDLTSEESIDKLVDEVKSTPSFKGIDVFISNSGISDSYCGVSEAPRKVWLEHYTTNTLGPILTLQKLYPLLLLKNTRQLLFISSQAGSITGFLPISVSAYGQSKAALNYSIKELSFELEPEGFTVVAAHPGLVSTDMGQHGVQTFAEKGVDLSSFQTITPEESASGLVDVLNKMTPSDNGKFLNYDGTEAVF